MINLNNIKNILYKKINNYIYYTYNFTGTQYAFMYLKEDIIAIQKELNIVGYTNQEMAEEADKNAREYLRKFEKFHGPLEDAPSILI